MGMDVDRAKALRFLEAHPPPGRLLQLGVTGAHFYGFPSPDSDVDLKGVHLAPTEALLGLDRPTETFDRLLDFEALEHDLTTHEAARALSLLLKGNGNLLERFLSPIQIVEGPEVDALAELARGSISRRFAGHYKGFFQGMQREHALKQRAKTMLYSYRVALTGIHLMHTGELVGDATVLAPEYGYPEVLEVVRFKGESDEHATLPEDIDASMRAGWTKLEAELVEAEAKSTLPVEPPNRADMDAWLRELRLGAL